MREHRTPEAVPFIDALGFWLDDQKRAGRLRRRCKRLGLSPSPLYRPSRRGFTVSLGPAWDRPDDLRGLLDLAARLDARVTRIDVALDVFGMNSRRARHRFLASLDDPCAGDANDMIRLNGRSPRIPLGRTAGSWITHHEGGASYARPRRARRNLVAYSDLPSKLSPDYPAGQPVFHVEARLRSPLIPTDPLAIFDLLDGRKLVRLLAKHVELKRSVRLLLPGPLARAYTRAYVRAVVTSST